MSTYMKYKKMDNLFMHIFVKQNVYTGLQRLDKTFLLRKIDDMS